MEDHEMITVSKKEFYFYKNLALRKEPVNKNEIPENFLGEIRHIQKVCTRVLNRAKNVSKK
jgi:hypothetical protein